MKEGYGLLSTQEIENPDTKLAKVALSKLNPTCETQSFLVTSYMIKLNKCSYLSFEKLCVHRFHTGPSAFAASLLWNSTTLLSKWMLVNIE
jgi:hypothetical protein